MMKIVVFCLVAALALASACDLSEIAASNVVKKGDVGYDDAKHQWASAMGTTTLVNERLAPEFIVYCNTDAHVVSAITYAGRCGYKISVRSGGHQYAGFSSCVAGNKCMQLDVSGMEIFTHEAGTNKVTVGVGLTIAQIIYQLVPRGYVLPMGVCNSVGAGGHFQSSSLGFFARSFGLGMDHVISFRIAKADATIETVTAQSNPDLYWAVLGGAPGSWGVLLDYTFEAIPASSYPHSRMSIYMWPYSRAQFIALTTKYMELMQDQTVSRDIVPLLVVSPPEHAPAFGMYTHFISLYLLWTGIDSGALDFNKYIQPFLDTAPHLPAPFPGFTMPVPINHAMATFRFDFDHRPFRYQVHSISTDNFFNAEFITAAADELDARMAIPGMYSSFQLQGYGGAGEGSQLNRNTGKNAFPWRNLKIHMDDWVFYLQDAQSQVAIDRIEGFRTKTEQFWRAKKSAESSWMTTDTSSVTQADLENDWEKYFPDKVWFRKLQKVKGDVDKCDVFSHNMTIPLKRTTKNEKDGSCNPLSGAKNYGQSKKGYVVGGVAAAGGLMMGLAGTMFYKRRQQRKARMNDLRETINGGDDTEMSPSV